MMIFKDMFFMYICILYIYTHFSQAGDISRCFPSCSFFTEGPRALQFQEVLRQILDLKDETPEVALRIRRGTCQTFPQQIESYQVNCYFGWNFWWKLWGKRFWKKFLITFQVNCACFYMFCGFYLLFFLKLEYVSVDGFFLNIPWEAQFQSFGDAPLKLPWKNKTKPGNSSVWYIDSWSNYSDLTRPRTLKNVAEAGKSLELFQGNLGWWNINNRPKKLNFRTNPVSPVGFKDVFSFTSKLRQISSTSLECKFTMKTEGSKKSAPKFGQHFSSCLQ